MVADRSVYTDVNADRIRTGLMTDEMVQDHSKARGLAPEAYRRGNLVGRGCGSGFVHLAKVRASTGAVITVDGGKDDRRYLAGFEFRSGRPIGRQCSGE